jgi:hypothetical protein
VIRRNFVKLIFLVLAVLVVVSVVSAFAANIVVPPTRLTDQANPITISELAPAECSTISSSLTALVVCTGGSCSGSNANELIIGTTGYDEIDAKNGTDCVVGGGGDDDLNGGNDDDVIIGAAGNDTLDGGPKKDTDICYGGSGTNIFNECDLTP